jgi:tRNA-specific 2-thiouridylase
MRIAVAMSGGMDSTASALLLKREGHSVTGMHMHLHEGSHQTWCHAQSAAEEVGVPLHRVDLSGEFADKIIKHFVDEYSAGRTPSPCPLCNRLIKMTLLYESARALGCEKLATGHYARIAEVSGEPALLRGADKAKDQSYFLFMLSREMLRRTLFPVGGMTKRKVRELLKKEGLRLWESEESQELCFVPDCNYRNFLLDRGVAARPGPIVDEHGRALGQHKGIIGYTVGQRRGLGVCGPRPLYVVRIDAATDTVVVGTKEHTTVALMRIARPNILRSATPAVGERFEVKVRSTSRAAACTVAQVWEDALDVKFDEPQSGVAPGQAAVLYDGDRVVAGGWIENVPALISSGNAR